MAADQVVFSKACSLIESAIPVHQGTRKVDYLDGDMFCRYLIPSGLIHIRSDTQIDAVLVFSTIDLQPVLTEAYPAMLITRNGATGVSDNPEEPGGIGIEIDGFPCKKCHSFHSTLTWHEKYNDYLLNDALWVAKYRESLQKYGLDRFGSAAQKQFDDKLERKGLTMSESVEQCIICSSPTCFFDSSTGHFICSDECHSKDGNE